MAGLKTIFLLRYSALPLARGVCAGQRPVGAMLNPRLTRPRAALGIPSGAWLFLSTLPGRQLSLRPMRAKKRRRQLSGSLRAEGFSPALNRTLPSAEFPDAWAFLDSLAAPTRRRGRRKKGLEKRGRRDHYNRLIQLAVQRSSLWIPPTSLVTQTVPNQAARKNKIQDPRALIQ